MSQTVNPLGQPSYVPKSTSQNARIGVVVDNTYTHNDQSESKSIFYWGALILTLGWFLILIPLLEVAVGGKYINSTSCVSHGVNGTQVLFVKGFFGLIYLILFVIHWCKRSSVDFKQSFWKNIKSFHIVFLIITLLYAALHFILMVLEFVFLNQCTDYIQNVSGMLWVSALTTVFMITYIIFTILRPILC